MLERNFDETEELHKIASNAESRTKSWALKKGLNPNDPDIEKASIARRKMKNHSNEIIKRTIKHGKSEEAKLVRAALAEAGIDKDFNIKTVDIEAAKKSNLTESDVRAKVAEKRVQKIGTSQAVDAKSNMNKLRGTLEVADTKAAKKGLIETTEVAAKKGLTRLGKAVPVIGGAHRVASVAYNVYQGNYLEAGVDVVSEIPVVGTAFGVGYAAGTVVNEFLSEDTKEAIGGTIAETLEHGWENVKSFYFGN